jgi:hypothetical protein
MTARFVAERRRPNGSQMQLRNLTAGEVTLRWADRQVHLPPLAQKTLPLIETRDIDGDRLADCPYVESDESSVHGESEGRFKHRLSAVSHWMRDKAALLTVLGIGFALPTVSLLFATHLFSDLRPDVAGALEPPLSAVVTLRLLQVLFLGVAITFPALLYFLFDRQRASTLRRRFVLQMFRFDPRVRTRTDVDAFYGRQMDEAFGSTRFDDTSNGVPVGHRMPMVVTTLVLAIGWIIASINLYALDVTTADAQLDIAKLFRPAASVLAFGFLGAYFFAVNSVLRSYVRGDLQPKMYSQITARVLVVVVLTALITVTDWSSNRALTALAFFAGIVPDTVLQLIWEKTRGLFRIEGRDPLVQNQPLTELDGIDIYERARLSSEGVENVEALAHGNIVDLLLQTRIQGGRLIDWVDQAILYIHTSAGCLPASDGSDSQKSEQQKRRALFDALRAAGIRTATDLDRAGRTMTGRQEIIKALSESLTEERLHLIVRSVEEAQWMPNLRRWRDDPQPESCTFYLDPPIAPLFIEHSTNGTSHRP